MIRNIMEYFDYSFVMTFTVVLMALGIMSQISMGIFLQKLIHDTDILSGADSAILKECKERFVNCYKLNSGIGNISVFVDKFINRQKIAGMSVGFIKHLSGQFVLAGVFAAGVGVCKGIVDGQAFIELIPFYIISLFGLYAYLSVSSMVDIVSKRKNLKTNLIDYLENHVAQRLKKGLIDKDMLLRELSREINTDKNNNVDKNIDEYEENIYDDISSDKKIRQFNFSKEEAKELEGLLKTFINSES